MPAAVNRIADPQIRMEELRYAENLSTTILALRKSNMLTSLAALGREEINARSPLQDTTRSIGVINPGYETIKVLWWVTIRRRAAATVLAIRLYEADHAGRLPSTLTELAPEYLPTVPADPFSPGNSPLSYVPAHNPPIIYSFGMNEKDDGGDSSNPNNNYPLDFVFPIHLPTVPSMRP